MPRSAAEHGPTCAERVISGNHGFPEPVDEASFREMTPVTTGGDAHVTVAAYRWEHAIGRREAAEYGRSARSMRTEVWAAGLEVVWPGRLPPAGGSGTCARGAAGGR